MTAGIDQSALIALIVGASSKLDVLWQLFIGLHFGVFALLLIHKLTLTLPGRAVALAGYLMFLGINFNALAGTYTVLHAAHDQFRKDYGRAAAYAPTFKRSFVDADLSDRPQVLMFTHGFAFLIVAICLFRTKSVVSDATKQQGSVDYSRGYGVESHEARGYHNAHRRDPHRL
ncbi:MAG: hypothetical protein NW215_10305 [Hyphomicrobiales bacterium]|nr:hypothetical protein [Hyphomicrobiales bacterium]